MTLLAWGIFSSSARAGELVNLYDFGADETGYLSLPSQQPIGSILFVPDSFGERGVVRQRCDLMAKLGYVALMVDLYNGNASENPEVARRMQYRLDLAAAQAAIQAGLKLLGESPRYRTETIIVAVWGENFTVAVDAAREMETFLPSAFSWLEPKRIDDLNTNSWSDLRLPLQLILRREIETKSNEFDAVLTQFDQRRGMRTEVYTYQQPQGFLLEPKSSPEAVEAWSALIQFWKQVITDPQPQSTVAEIPASSTAPAASEKAKEKEKTPRSLVTRPRAGHPRLN
jgi:carboxymethylenebutenolidase